MSQKTVYACDFDGKPIGEKMHLSLSFSNHSGIALPPGQGPGKSATNYWVVACSHQGKFMHFCSTEHLALYFEKLIKTLSKK